MRCNSSAASKAQRIGKYAEGAVARRFHDRAVMPFHAVARDFIMRRDSSRHGCRTRLPLGSASLDVGEYESDDSDRSAHDESWKIPRLSTFLAGVSGTR